jgi:2-hydroxy-6-oxonona-2,4-dienedioate hydrolase
MNEEAYRREERRLWEANGLEPTEHWFELAATGTKVRVQEVGNGDPVLFVHGGPSAGSEWAPLVAHLPGVRSLLVDRPGTGLSEPSLVTPAQLRSIGPRIVGDVLDGLGLDRAHVVGSSFGGHLALRSAAATPERFSRMIQIGCPAFVPGDAIPPFMRLMRYRLVGRLINLLPPSQRANRAIMRQMGHGKSIDAGRIPAAFDIWYLALQRHTDTMRNDGELVRGFLPAWQDSTLTEDLLSQVRSPTLFVWGAEDTFGGRDVAERLVTAMPDAELEMLPDAGHLPWLDDPERAAATVQRFLTGSPAPALHQ